MPVTREEGVGGGGDAVVFFGGHGAAGRASAIAIPRLAFRLASRPESTGAAAQDSSLPESLLSVPHASPQRTARGGQGVPAFASGYKLETRAEAAVAGVLAPDASTLPAHRCQEVGGTATPRDTQGCTTQNTRGHAV